MAETIAKEESPHSVKLAINAKGQLSGEVKVYAGSIDEAYNTACIYAEKLAEKIKTTNA